MLFPGYPMGPLPSGEACTPVHLHGVFSVTSEQAPHPQPCDATAGPRAALP